jgi:hypothetical protein
MNIKNNNKNESIDKPMQSEELSSTEFNGQTNEEKPTKRVRRQATQEQLDNPFHGVKLVQFLERLVEYYGW